MEILSLNHITAAYPGQNPVLNDISLQINQGDFAVIIGKSGSGKTSLLSLIKGGISTLQITKGALTLFNTPANQLSAQSRAFDVGYLFQNPYHSVVCDTVWHELAFVAENMGLPPQEIHRRVAEISAFFHLEQQLYQPISQLSGGQLQAVALAAVCTGYPRLLLLDEPTSQLDPASARSLLQMVYRLNQELGITIVMVDHRLEDILPLCNRLVLMEKGRLMCSDSPQKTSALMRQNPQVATLLPAAARLCLNQSEVCLTTLQARGQLQTHPHTVPRFDTPQPPKGNRLLYARDIWFCYSNTQPPLLRGADVQLHQGEIQALVGQNGSGKSTLLYILNSALKPLEGKVRKNCATALLPQQVQLLFSYNTVQQELQKTGADTKIVQQIIDQLNLSPLLQQHPYDLSGGETQRLGIALMLCTGADILLMDEPTKGLDNCAKKQIGTLLQQLAAGGKSILLVTHDLDFAAATAHTVCQLSAGKIFQPIPSRNFFVQNRFYTTQAARICRGFCNAVQAEEVAKIAPV